MSIASKIQRLIELGATLATTLRAKGVEASDTEGFESLVPKVAEIEFDDLFNRLFFSTYAQAAKSSTYTFPSYFVGDLVDKYNVMTTIANNSFKGGVFTTFTSHSTNEGSINSYAFMNCENLTRVECDGVTQLQGDLFYNTLSLKDVICPKVTSIGLRTFRTSPSPFVNVVVGKLTSVNNNISYYPFPRLRNFTVGVGTDVNLNFANWNASIIIPEGEQSCLELISNARTGLYERVADHTGEGLARTITASWVGTLSESEYESVTDALEQLMTDFAEKGWTLQG